MKHATAVLLVLASMLSACSQLTVRTDYDRSVQFTGLRTYNWRPDTPPDTGDPRFDTPWLGTRVRTAVNRVLAAKGYQKSTGGSPDFVVGYYLVLKERTTDFVTINRRFGYGWGGFPETHSDDYTQGTLLIDVIDPKTMQLMWRGSASGVVDRTASREKRERRITAAVDAVLKKFPPGT